MIDLDAAPNAVLACVGLRIICFLILVVGGSAVRIAMAADPSTSMPAASRAGLLDRRVLVSTHHVQQVDWAGKAFHIGFSREQIERGFEFDPGSPPPGDFAKALESRAADWDEECDK